MAGPILQMNARERRLVGVSAFVGARRRSCSRSPSGSRRSSASERVRQRRPAAGARRRAGRARPRARAPGEEGRDRRALRDARRRRSPGSSSRRPAQQKLEVTDSTPLPDVPHGKRYTEHGTNIHLKKAGMLAARAVPRGDREERLPGRRHAPQHPEAQRRARLLRRRGRRRRPTTAPSCRRAGAGRRERQAVKERLLKYAKYAALVGYPLFYVVCLARLRVAHVPVRQAAGAHRRDVQRAAARQRRPAGAPDRRA